MQIGEPLAGEIDVSMRDVDADAIASEGLGYCKSSACPAKRVQYDASGRASCQNRNTAKVGGIRRKMAVLSMCVFGQDVPDICGLASIGVVFEKIKAIFSQFFCPAGYFCSVGVSCALLPSDNHSKVRNQPAPYGIQNLIKCPQGVPLLGRTQRLESSIWRLYLTPDTPVAEITEPFSILASLGFDLIASAS